MERSLSIDINNPIIVTNQQMLAKYGTSRIRAMAFSLQRGPLVEDQWFETAGKVGLKARLYSEQGTEDPPSCQDRMLRASRDDSS